MRPCKVPRANSGHHPVGPSRRGSQGTATYRKGIQRRGRSVGEVTSGIVCDVIEEIPRHGINRCSLPPPDNLPTQLLLEARLPREVLCIGERVWHLFHHFGEIGRCPPM